MSFGQQPYRIPPLGQPGDYVTYSISARPDTGRVWTCREVGCEQYRLGWQCTFDESRDCGNPDWSRLCFWLAEGPLPCGRCQAQYVRYGSGRTFKEQRTETGLTVFRFEPFQRCFADHGTAPDIFRVRDGDWRGNPTQRVRLHANGLDWIEDLIEHEGALADLRRKG